MSDDFHMLINVNSSLVCYNFELLFTNAMLQFIANCALHTTNNKLAVFSGHFSIASNIFNIVFGLQSRWEHTFKSFKYCECVNWNVNTSISDITEAQRGGSPSTGGRGEKKNCDNNFSGRASPTQLISEDGYTESVENPRRCPRISPRTH